MPQTIEKQLDEIRDFIAHQSATPKGILTLHEASIYIGISKSFLYKLTSGRQIPHFKPGGKKIYFRLADLESWVLSNRTATVKELESHSLNKKN